ncbi:c-type cytochrome biogenesis protein CcmI [Pararhizobium haloflavum]|uniref:c-type cytochrome biogenesis protein CcmI n=1 Tax=Pararhizobium haloflavum TaxID=2037914 RepID=UPI000C1830B0|nr:c-type cytochrome biogenesis protein CcmI [Pararhizobium haloflavum]
MMFWVLAAILTAVVTIALLLPLARRVPVVAGGDHDVEVYSDQLSEVDRDSNAGLIDEAEAEYARAEIARRLLRADRRSDAGIEERSGRMRRVAQVGVIVAVPAIAMGAYLTAGSPGLPDQPLASRAAPPSERSGPEMLIAQAEAHLADNPDDGRGWDVLAPIYLRMGRFDDAEMAYANAMRILGPSAERHSGYGETLVAAAGGVISEEARIAFQSARELEPDEPKAAFYLAMALVQEGRNERALQAFEDLAETSPPDAPWMEVVDAQIATLDRERSATGSLTLAPLELPNLAGSQEPSAPSGSSAPSDEAAAIQSMPESERREMIVGMVESLDARLRENPDNADGWMRLMRSYSVLGRDDAANDALTRALEAFPRDSEQGAALLALASELGIDAPAEEAQ